jgi:hypothetical protein
VVLTWCKAQINDAVTVKFIVDSGAANVTIPQDVVLTLFRGGSLARSDFIGTQTYVLADGSELPSPQFVIHSLKLGSHVVRNVVASVAPVEADPLLGQSFLSKLPAWTFDNSHGRLVVTDEPSPSYGNPPPQPVFNRCRVTDPNGTPLNVRTSPNGSVVASLPNGMLVSVINRAIDERGRGWVYIENYDTGQLIGWVFREFIACF